MRTRRLTEDDPAIRAGRMSVEAMTWLTEKERPRLSDERVVRGEDGVAPCFWGSSPPEYQAYDTEWGFPVDDDRRLFEKLVLEGSSRASPG